ncbi:MAG: META domain-containing protein [Bacteroidota bacterium]|nr:META domain-containing protein [Bacteroidota bacterium]
MNTFLNVKRTTLLFSFILICTTLINCNKDKTDTIDITKHKWKIESITTNDTIYKTQGKVPVKHAYLLVFDSDSSFSLNTSVNTGGGIYDLISNGLLKITCYGGTKVGGENEFDDKLREVLPLVVSYQVIGNNLILKGEEGEIVLKKTLL